MTTTPFDTTATQPALTAIRIPRVEQLLGCRLDQLDWYRLTALVADSLAEDLSLDLKADLYAPVETLTARTPEDWAQAKLAKAIEPAKDVAAFANTAGGIILVGVAEDGDGHGINTPGVAIDQRERRKIIDAIVPRVHPWAHFEVLTLADPADTSRGVFVIVVPASDAAPHLVNYGAPKDPAYRVPVRVDRDTVWLGEHQLAARYRDRFRSETAAVSRVRDVAVDGTGCLIRDDRGWVTLTVVPSRAGSYRRTTSTSQAWVQDLYARLQGLVLPQNTSATIGRGRVIHSGEHSYTGTSASSHMELYHDGAGFAASQIVHSYAWGGLDGAVDPGAFSLNATDLQQVVLGSLQVLASHALDTGGGGDLLLRAALVLGIRESEPAPIEVHIFGTLGSRRVGQSLTVVDPHPFETTTSFAVATQPTDLVAAAAEICRELLAEFAIDRPLLLGEDGTINASGLGHGGDIRRLQEWAERHGATAEA